MWLCWTSERIFKFRWCLFFVEHEEHVPSTAWGRYLNAKSFYAKLTLSGCLYTYLCFWGVCVLLKCQKIEVIKFAKIWSCFDFIIITLFQLHQVTICVTITLHWHMYNPKAKHSCWFSTVLNDHELYYVATVVHHLWLFLENADSCVLYFTYGVQKWFWTIAVNHCYTSISIPQFVYKLGNTNAIIPIYI